MEDFKLTVPSNTEFIGDINKDKDLILLEDGNIKVDIPLEDGYSLRLPDDFCKVVDKTVGAVTIELKEYEYQEVSADAISCVRKGLHDLYRGALGVPRKNEHNIASEYNIIDKFYLGHIHNILQGKRNLDMSEEYRKTLDKRVLEKLTESNDGASHDVICDPYSHLADLLGIIDGICTNGALGLPRKDQPALYHDMCIKGKLSDSMAYTIKIDEVPKSIKGQTFDISLDSGFVKELAGCTNIKVCSIDWDAMYCKDHGLEQGDVCSTNLDDKYARALSNYLCLYAYNNDFSISRFICIKRNNAEEVKP